MNRTTRIIAIPIYVKKIHVLIVFLFYKRKLNVRKLSIEAFILKVILCLRISFESHMEEFSIFEANYSNTNTIWKTLKKYQVAMRIFLGMTMTTAILKIQITDVQGKMLWLENLVC